MADIADAKANLNDIEISADAALSEALFEKIGGAINYLNTTTDTHTSQLSGLLTETVAKSSQASGTTTSTSFTNIASQAITPTGTNVLVVIEGQFSQDLGNAGSVRIQRNGSTIRTESVGVGFLRQDMTVLDTGATSSSSNTYTVDVQAQSGNTLTYDCYISLIDIK